MRRCYLVCYDIRNSKRLQRVHKILKGYGEAWQFSVFFCILREIDRVRLQSDLEEVLNLKHDQVIILDLGANEEKARQAASVIGQQIPESLSTTIIV